MVFVLCTTEPHKLLDTIKGRCQAFAFARPSVEEIRVVLRRIAAAEGIEADEDALGLIARSARGSFRDAVSQLDQLATACGGVVSAADARALLGIVEEHVLRGIVDAAAARNAPAALRAVDDLATAGQDLGQLVGDLLAHLRLLLLTRELGEVPASAPLADEARAALAEQAGRVDERLVVTLLQGLLGVLDELRDGGDPRLPLELELVRASRPSTDRSIEAILRRLDALEVGGPAPIPPPAPVPIGAAPVAAPAGHAAARRRAAGTCASRCAAGRLCTAGPSGGRGDAAVGRGAGAGTRGRAGRREPRQSPRPSLQRPPRRRHRPSRPATTSARSWRLKILARVAERRPSLAPHLEPATPSLSEGVLRLQFPSSAQFQKSFADTEANRAIVAEAVTAVLGERRRIVLETLDAPAVDAPRRLAIPEPLADEPVLSEEDSEAALIRGFVDAFDAHEIEEES